MSPRDPYKVEVHKRCGEDDCWHERQLHNKGSGACGIAGCRCGHFLEVEVPREKRAPIVKTLDKEEPKLFEPELAPIRRRQIA